jgi:AcrR family transcriptional regulator
VHPVTAPQQQAQSTERAERTRRRILEAAGRCFADLGFAKATVEEIARAAGVSKALVYVHFRGKEELLEAVFEATLDEWGAFTWSEVERDGTSSIAAAIAIMHRASIDYARDHPLLRSIMNRESAIALAPHLRPLGRRAQERWRERLVGLIEAGIESGELRADLAPGQVADVVRLLHLAFLDRLFDPEPINVASPELIETSMKVLHGGILRCGPVRS